jgi:hypothetical protein
VKNSNESLDETVVMMKEDWRRCFFVFGIGLGGLLIKIGHATLFAASTVMVVLQGIRTHTHKTKTVAEAYLYLSGYLNNKTSTISFLVVGPSTL